jgi:hypothetical protein
MPKQIEKLLLTCIEEFKEQKYDSIKQVCEIIESYRLLFNAESACLQGQPQKLVGLY